MKEIIYLDTNFLNSFLAQINGGLPTIKSREESEEIKDSLESSEGHRSGSSIEATIKTGEFEIPLFLKTPSGEMKGIWRPGQFSEEKAIASQTEAAKQIISTQMHDNALEEFITYLNNKNELYTPKFLDNNYVGKYLSQNSSFKIIDFDYLVKIMQADKFTRFMFKEMDEKVHEMETEIKNAPNEKKSTKEFQQYKGQFKAKLEQVNKEKEKKFKEMEDVQELLKYLTDILPNSTFILTDGLIVPLKADFLREKGEELSFKYGDSSDLKITLLGKVTGIIENPTLPSMDSKQAVDTVLNIHQILYFILSTLNLIKKGDLIVSPVAIYFE